MKEKPDPMANSAEIGILPASSSEADLFLKNSISGDALSSRLREQRSILLQQEGLDALGSFLLRRAGFESLGPFRLDLSGQKYKRQSGQYQFYLGKIEEGSKNPFYLSISPSVHLGRWPEELYVMPKAVAVGEGSYHWIDFFEHLPDEVGQKPFLSYRLRPDHATTKIDSIHWRGLEEQLLVDFIRGENGIRFENLSPFSIKLNSKRSPYCLGGLPGFAFRFANNSRVNENDELLVVPNTDPQKIYTWIDIYKQGRSGEQGLLKVSSCRIHQDEKALVTLGWRNPEIQYLIDYLSRDPKVAFGNLRPVRVKLPEKFNQVSIGRGAEKYYQISIGNSKELGIDEVILMPKQDPKELYQWVEAYRFDPETGKPIGEPIASVRMIQGVGFERTGWLGAGRQSLIDYANGERSFSDLLPIPLRVGVNTKMLDIWSVQKEHVYLILSVKSDFKTGDYVELVPEKEEEGVVAYRMIRGQLELGLYSFNRKTKRFSVVELHDVRSIAELKDTTEADNYLRNLVYGEDET